MERGIEGEKGKWYDLPPPSVPFFYESNIMPRKSGQMSPFHSHTKTNIHRKGPFSLEKLTKLTSCSKKYLILI